MSWQREYVLFVRVKKLRKINPHLAMYIHITNLHTLFEFCIPCIQDYGVALKGNNFGSFLQCYDRLLLSSSVVGVRVLGTTIVRCWCVVSSATLDQGRSPRCTAPSSQSYSVFRGEQRDCP